MREFEYRGDNATHANFPLGGIGAGCIGLGADGRFRDWEIFNRPNKGSVNGFTHFAVRAERDGEVLDTRVLHGPFQGSLTGDHLGPRFGSYGFGVRRAHMVGFPSFEDCTLTGPYPAASLQFADKRFPGDVAMSALSPFIPMDSRASSMPVAMFEFAITNSGSEPIDYTLFGCFGFEFKNKAEAKVEQAGGRTTLVGRSHDDPASIDYSELALSFDGDDISYQHNMFRGSWFDALEVYWQDITRGGRLKDRRYDAADDTRLPGGRTMPEHGVLANHVTVAPGETRKVRAAIAWYVPNVSKYWISSSTLLEDPADVPLVWKNYYATQWSDAPAVADAAFGDWDRLTGETRRLQDVLKGMTLPLPVRDAVSANISIMKTATILRLEDGTFYGWEGCHPDAGSCEGSCTHVWNYQQAVPFLFPDLERSMREADYRFNQIADSGGMAFRLSLPLGIGTSNDRPCADGQMGNVLKTYRDWKMSGDDDWLKEWWPNVKAAVSYAWHPGNYDLWDPDKTGVMTGRQHHTLDMELFGASAWLNGLYLGALKAGAEMADAVGDSETAAEFREIFERGKSWTNENLYNGTYFVQKVDLADREQLTPFDKNKSTDSNIVAGSVYDLYWSDEHGEIKYQIGEGCGIDQVLAQWHANLYGIGEIFEPAKFESAVRAIYDNNFTPRLGDIANPCRVYGAQEESGTLMCAWPADAERPAIPVPYTQETMHGFEYAFGTQLMMIGELEKGLEVFSAVRDRYAGHNRNPWNEIECGSNYARSMASYAAVLVLSGFAFDMSRGEVSFAPKVQSEGRYESIWSAGAAWGRITIAEGEARLDVLGGKLALDALTVNGTRFETDRFEVTGGNSGNGGNLGPGASLAVRDPALSLAALPDIKAL